MSNNRANGSYFKPSKSDIKKIHLVYSRYADEDQAEAAGVEKEGFKSNHDGGDGVLTESKTANSGNNPVVTSFKSDNNVYPDMNYHVKEHERSTEVGNVFLHAYTEVTRDAEARYLYGVLMQYINFGKNREHIAEDDLRFIDEYESLDEPGQQDFINDLMAVSKGNKIKERHLTF